jgi:hypothetical protein
VVADRGKANEMKLCSKKITTNRKREGKKAGRNWKEKTKKRENNQKKLEKESRKKRGGRLFFLIKERIRSVTVHITTYSRFSSLHKKVVSLINKKTKCTITLLDQIHPPQQEFSSSTLHIFHTDLITYVITAPSLKVNFSCE